MVRNVCAITVAMLAVAFGPPALAQAGEFSIGAGIGTTNIQGARTVEPGVPFLAGQRLDQSDTAFELFGSYRVNRFVSIELGYQDFGNATKTFALNPDVVFIRTPSDTQTVDITALSVGGVFEYPVTDAFSVFASGGLARHDIDVRWTSTLTLLPFGTAFSNHDISAYYGAGIRYRVSEPWALRLSWRGSSPNAGGEEFDLSTFAVAVEYRF
ncbi:MAG: hypothetical protein CVU24_18185 [Betaproteobacteria bacterium HGW-Betaproteobacteria-18]|nr:MAG: hypothetical protein CVU24_18185 [Betaproteobacteria bacterium HGW-Betaproteobacteria-18]